MGVVQMFEAAVKHVDAMTVAFVSMQGAYIQIPDAMGKLYGWTASQGWQPVGMPMGVYLSDPATVPEEQAVWELWAPIAGDHEASGPDASGLGVKRVHAGTVAWAMHKGPYEEIGPVYEQLMAWVHEHGYTLAGPPREAYMSDPAEVPPSEYLTEVQIPVAPVL